MSGACTQHQLPHPSLSRQLDLIRAQSLFDFFASNMARSLGPCLPSKSDRSHFYTYSHPAHIELHVKLSKPACGISIAEAILQITYDEETGRAIANFTGNPSKEDLLDADSISLPKLNHLCLRNWWRMLEEHAGLPSYKDSLPPVDQPEPVKA